MEEGEEDGKGGEDLVMKSHLLGNLTRKSILFWPNTEPAILYFILYIGKEIDNIHKEDSGVFVHV